MEQHFNTPSEVIDTNMKAGEGKAHLLYSLNSFIPYITLLS